jgi:hypothetical protein
MHPESIARMVVVPWFFVAVLAHPAGSAVYRGRHSRLWVLEREVMPCSANSAGILLSACDAVVLGY